MMRRRSGGRSTRPLLGLLLAIAAGAAGCGPEPAPGRPVTTDGMLGEPLTSVYTTLGYQPGGPSPAGLQLVLQDITPAVAGRPAGPDPGAGVDGWAVLSACYQPTPGQLTLGVVRTADVPADGGPRARQRSYDRFLGGCDGAVPTFRVLPPPG